MLSPAGGGAVPRVQTALCWLRFVSPVDPSRLHLAACRQVTPCAAIFLGPADAAGLTGALAKCRRCRPDGSRGAVKGAPLRCPPLWTAEA